MGTPDLDGTKYEDTSTTVYPGDTFTVLKKDAKMVVEEEDEDGNVVKATYTVQLRAEYGPAETPVDTHIDWYQNYTTTDTTKIKEDKDLQINEAVDICDAPSRDGYVFMGWAKAAHSVTGSDNPTEVNFL